MAIARLPILPPGPVYATGTQTHLWVNTVEVAAVDPIERPLNGMHEPSCLLRLRHTPVALRVALPADETAALLGWGAQ